MDIVTSINRIPVRLPAERWLHIVEGHPELAGYYHDVLGTVAWPEFIVKGEKDELLAITTVTKGKYLVVVYREASSIDGFVITAFLTRRIRQIERRELIWKRQM
jgi:hypothetical protein